MFGKQNKTKMIYSTYLTTIIFLEYNLGKVETVFILVGK